MPLNPSGADLYLDWQSDLILTPSGGLQTAVAWDRVRQRVIRRMITNPAQLLPSGRYTPADYIFEPSFGIGMGSLVDQPFSTAFLEDLESRISQACLQDDDIDSSSPPTVQFFQEPPSTLFILISVVSVSGAPGKIAVRYGN